MSFTRFALQCRNYRAADPAMQEARTAKCPFDIKMEKKRHCLCTAQNMTQSQWHRLQRRDNTEGTVIQHFRCTYEKYMIKIIKRKLMQ